MATEPVFAERRCINGPLIGQLLPRRPQRGSKGVLLVDKPNQKVWWYAYDPEDETFRVVRGPEPLRNHWPESDSDDTAKRAAQETEWDVTAAPWEEAEV